jgi:hypothetical protein
MTAEYIGNDDFHNYLNGPEHQWEEEKAYTEYLEEKVRITEKAKELSFHITDEGKRLVWIDGFVNGYFYR